MVATTKRDVADIRIVSLHHQSPGNICAIVLVRPDAPDLKTPDEWLKWLNGKRFGVAGRASCGDRFTSYLETRLGVKFGDKAYLGPEVIRTQLQAGTIDAAQQFEPNVSQIVASGIAKIAFTGNVWNWTEGSALIMRVQQNYEVDLDPALPEILGGVDHEVEPIKETTGVPGSEIPHCPRCCEPAPVFVHARSPCSPTASLARRRRASFSR